MGKKHTKSKAQIEQEMRAREAAEAQKKEVERRRALAKDVFYPLLLKRTKSIREAQRICKIFENAITTIHNNELAIKTLAETKLADQFVNDNDEAHVIFREILEIFKDEKLNSCIEIIGGMSGAIDSFIAEEQASRPLSDLKVRFL